MNDEEKAPQWAINLVKTVENVHAKLDVLAENVEILQHDAKDTRLRLGRLERELDEVKERQTNDSMRARSMSSTDEQHAAEIAGLITAVQELQKTQAEQLDLLRRLLAVAGNPMVRRVAYAVGGAVLAYLTAKGGLPR